MEQTRGKAATDKCFDDIKNIIYISLKSVQSVIINDKHCFEMYGYDILIEDNLKPWLIEVNASPSLSTTTEADRKLKMSVLESICGISMVSRHDERCTFLREVLIPFSSPTSNLQFYTKLSCIVS